MDGMAVAPFLEFATSSVSDRRRVVEVVHVVVVHVNQLRHPSARHKIEFSSVSSSIGSSSKFSICLSCFALRSHGYETWFMAAVIVITQIFRADAQRIRAADN